MIAFNDQICPICKLEDGSHLVEIRQKGADGINEASVKRSDSIVVTAGMKVHPECRRLYTNSRQIYLHLQKKQYQ